MSAYLMVIMFRHSQRYLHSLHLIGFYFAYSLNQEITRDKGRWEDGALVSFSPLTVTA